MSTLEGQTDRGRCWICALCVACLLLLYAIGGAAWRTWQFESRGIEREGARDLGVGARSSRPMPSYSMAGINVDLAQYDADGLDRALSDVSSLGFAWLRQGFPWQAIEPAPGVYHWERWDAVVEAVDSHGLALIAVLDAPPAWAASGHEFPLPCRPPVREDAYARFVSAFAQRYGAVIDHYQVWDEPNLSQSWAGGHVQPCGYAVLLEAAYPAIQGADSTAWVLAGGLAPTQAPGPDDLNDLAYLRQLYAQGGEAYFDILATKPYGFWSGPEDRRVHPDVLNYSRVIAQREQVRARPALRAGKDDKPVWAVEWGWNVLPEGWAGEAPPWGSDTIAVQRPRILGAVVRARTEWPWMGVKCWTEYQPDVPDDDPRWGFALRDRDGAPTALYATLQDAVRLEFRIDKGLAPGAGIRAAPVTLRYGLLLALIIAGSLDASVLWRRSRCGDAARRLWRRWSSLPPLYPVLALVGLALLYVTIPWPEWILLVLVLAAAILYNHPRWALLGAVFCIPFFYTTKQVMVGTALLEVSPSEILLLLAIGPGSLRAVRAHGWIRADARPVARWSALDGLWLLWVALGALSPLIAPDAAYAWREWRLTMLGPVLVYLLLRCHTAQAVPVRVVSVDRGYSVGRDVLLAWLASGVVVALLGIGQWLAGAIVPAGDVGRVTSVYYSPNHLALYLERIWPLALVLALYGGLGRRWRWVAWASVGILSAGLYLTYSRAAWLLAIPLAVLVMIVSYRADESRAGDRRAGQHQGRRWWVAVVLVLAVLLVAVNVLLGRLTPLSALRDEIRLPVWRSTVEMIADHPWMGVGLDGFRFVYPRYMREEAWTEPLLYHPHNVWLDAAVRLGMPGLAVFVWLVAFCVREVVRLQRKTKAAHATLEYAVAVGCLASLWAGLAHGLVDSGYFVGDLAWILALVAGLVSGPLRELAQRREV